MIKKRKLRACPVENNTGTTSRREPSKFLLLLRGLPGSGKTTFARAISANNGWFHLERDRGIDVISMKWAGKNIIVDHTNLSPIHMEGWRKFAKRYKYRFYVLEFPLSVNQCVENDRARGDDAVGEDIIRELAKKYPAFDICP